MLLWDLSQGFLPYRDPIEKLPEKFNAWNQLGEEAPKLLAAGEFGKRVKNLPILDVDWLEGDEELECAMRKLSFFGHSEVFESWQTTPKQSVSVPIAIPWYKVAKKLERPPILSYASYALYNWRRLNKKSQVSLGNIALLQNFLGGLDEEWFILVHVAIEAQACDLFENISLAYDGVVLDIELLETALAHSAHSIGEINHILSRMTESCDPYIYYHRVRPYIHGWKGNPRLASGIIYEGVAELDGKPQQWRGETGAQSSIIPSLDVFLGIEHADKLPDGSPDILKTYLVEMRDYMPKEHREFFVRIEKTFKNHSVRQLVKKNRDRKVLVAAYNENVEGVAKFRKTHLGYAEEYIQRQSQRSPSNPTNTGTGGTPFIQYLEKHFKETTACLIL